MKYSTKLIIPPRVLGKLDEIGISDMNKLLYAGKTPFARKELSQKIDVSEDDILHWVQIADLLRVKGIGVKLAQILVETELANSVYKLSQSNPNQIHDAIKEINNRQMQVKTIVSKNAIAEIVEEAKHLKSDLILDIPEEFSGHQEKRETIKQASKVAYGFAYKSLKTIYTIVFLMGFLSIILGSFAARKYWFFTNEQLYYLTRTAETQILILRIICSSQILVTLLILVIMWWIIGDLQRNLFRKLEARIFNKPLYKQAFIDFTLSPNNASTFKYFFMLALSLVIGFATVISVKIFNPEDEGILVFWGAIFGILLSTLILFPSMKSLWNARSKIVRHTPGSLDRYRTWKLINWLFIPVVTVFLIQVGILLINGHRSLVQHVYLPAYEQSIRITKMEVMGISLENESSQAIETRESFIKAFTPELSQKDYQLFLLYTDKNLPIEQTFSKFFVTFIGWMIISSVFVYIVIPLFVFKKFKQATLFLLCAIGAYIMENLLTKYAPSLFFLPSGSITTFLFLLAVVLSNTLFFELLQGQSNDKGFCLICGRDHDDKAKYCPYCGNEIKTST